MAEDHFVLTTYEYSRASIIDFTISKMSYAGTTNIDDIIEHLNTMELIENVKLKDAFWFDVFQRPLIKKWLIDNDIIKDAGNDFFLLTDKGKDIKRKGGYANYLKIEKLQFDKIELDVIDLQNRIKNFKPSNRRANLALIFSAISIGIAALLLYLKLTGR